MARICAANIFACCEVSLGERADSTFMRIALLHLDKGADWVDADATRLMIPSAGHFVQFDATALNGTVPVR
jgi:hypothetical protein